MKTKFVSMALVFGLGFVMLFAPEAHAERYYYAGLNADAASKPMLDGFALYYDDVAKTYSILARREYLIVNDPHVYPGWLHGTFTDNGQGVLTTPKMFMRFYDDYVGAKDFCDVPVTMTLTWNKTKTAIRADNVVLPNRYPVMYVLFGCETLSGSDLSGPMTLNFTRFQ